MSVVVWPDRIAHQIYWRRKRQHKRVIIDSVYTRTRKRRTLARAFHTHKHLTQTHTDECAERSPLDSFMGQKLNYTVSVRACARAMDADPTISSPYEIFHILIDIVRNHLCGECECVKCRAVERQTGSADSNFFEFSLSMGILNVSVVR